MMIVLWAVGTVGLSFLGGLLGAAYFEYLDKGQREADEIAMNRVRGGSNYE